MSSQLGQSALFWASGYLAGRAAHNATQTATALAPLAIPAAANADTAPAAAATPRSLTILYGSQTGNAKRVATQLAERATASGIETRLVRADSYSVRDLKKAQLLYVVISTHSSGDLAEPPDDSVEFFENLMGKRAPKLPDLHYAVLALGDTSYPDFCGVGRDIDTRLAELGATRLFDRGDADVDIDTIADPWLDEALKQAQDAQGQKDQGGATDTADSGVVTLLRPAARQWDRKNPFSAEICVNQRVVADGHEKDVRHIELSLDGSGLTYEPGDALGVWPTHDAALVTAVLDTLGLDGAAEVSFEGESRRLADWLSHYRELTCLTRPFIAAHAERAGNADLDRLLTPEHQQQLAELLGRVQLVDFLRRYPATGTTQWSADDLVARLRPLAPRMYSIASSQKQVGEEVHLTVDRLHYAHDGEARWGVASHYLAGLPEGAKAPVFIDRNDRFRLPASPDTDVIMIGPGTGVAPFRAFVQERAESDGAGRNWLFFGNRHLRADFLYQTEWRQALKDGALDRFDVAFSRDQPERIYVQDRIREQAGELWQWLEAGAHVYVCGDAERMAPDVHAALVDVVAAGSGKPPAEAARFVQQLMSQGRYARDVY